MQLPFTIVFEPPRWSARTWLVSALIAGLTAATVGAFPFIVVRPAGGATPDEAGATLRVASQPPEATVAIDGRAVGQTPLTSAATPGDHHITLRREGYADSTYIVRLAAGDTRTLAGELWLTTPDVRRLRPIFPGATLAGATFLSDGRLALVVAIPPGDERQLWLVDKHGDARRAGPPSARGSIAIGADGMRVAYLGSGQRSNAGGLDEVWLADSDGSGAERRFALSSDSERLIDLSWAPDGNHLLFVSRQQVNGGVQRTHLRLLDVTTGATRDLVSLPSDVVPGSYTWSPDRSRLAVLAQVGQLTALCVLGPDGEFRYLADLAGDGTAPFPFVPLAWSPDGARLLYAGPPQEPPGSSSWPFGTRPTTALFTADATHPLPQQVPSSGGGQAPVWRTDDSTLFLARGQDGALVLRQIEPGHEPRDVTTLPLHVGATFAARWDAAHAQAVVAVSGAAGLGAGQPEYWLVRFRRETQR